MRNLFMNFVNEFYLIIPIHFVILFIFIKLRVLYLFSRARYLEALPDHVRNNYYEYSHSSLESLFIMLIASLHFTPYPDPHFQIKSKSVLELGSGCGLVGITASFLGARDVVLTDLPYVMPLMKENVNTNMTKVQASLCVKIRCMTCDWFNPPGVDEFGFSLIGSEYSKFPDVILIADCVWVEHLVNPLLKTIDCLTDGHTEVIISYQRRGRTTHEALWCGLRTLFNSFEEVKICDDLNLTKPDSLFLLRCRK